MPVQSRPFSFVNYKSILSRSLLLVPSVCILQHASGKRFQEVLEEAFVRPLNIDGELYIGIPPGMF